MIRKIFKKSVDVLIELKKRDYECYVLSNWSWETFQGINKKYPFINMFDGLIISGKEKLVKPDKKIYLLAISKFNLIPKETVFIDDRIENIKAAKKLSFKTIHLKNPELIKLKIKKFLL